MIPKDKLSQVKAKIVQISQKIVSNLKIQYYSDKNQNIDGHQCSPNNNTTSLESELVKNQEQQEKERQKSNYRIYSVQFKKQLVAQIKQQQLDTKKPLYSIIKAKSIQYSIHPKNLSRWCKLPEIRKKQGGRKAALPQIQQKLVQYILQNPKSKRRTIIELAKKCVEELNDPQKKKFNFSKGWYERFRARHLRIPKVKLQHNFSSQDSEKNHEVKKIELEAKQQKQKQVRIDHHLTQKVKIQENY